MARIKIFSDLVSGLVHFDGSNVSAKAIGTLTVAEHPTLTNRIVISSNVLFQKGSDTIFRRFFKKLNINRIDDENGQRLVNDLGMDRTAVIAHIQTIITKPTLTEYFTYNPDTDRLEAKKAIQTTLNSYHLGDQHKISSGAANIYFKDFTKNHNLFPVWGAMKDQSDTANQAPGEGLIQPTSRVFGDYGTVALGGQPVDDTSIAYDGDNFFPFNISGVGITTRVAEQVPATQRLKYELSVDGTLVYVQYLSHDGINVNEDLSWYFDHPLDIEAGSTNHASIYKVATVDNQEVKQGLLLVCKGDTLSNGVERYQTSVRNRLFTDKFLAYQESLDALVSGSEYQGAWDASTNTPDITLTGSEVNGSFYRVSVSGTYGGVDYEYGDMIIYNATTVAYDHIPVKAATNAAIEASSLNTYDIYVKAGFVSDTRNGSALYPFHTLETAIAAAADGDSIFIDGVFSITSDVVIPSNKSLSITGAFGSTIQYSQYNSTNGSLVTFVGTDTTKTLKFKNITFKNAGGYGLHLRSLARVEIDDCTFENNGWDGTALNTVLDSATSGVLGYDSSAADLQAFYAGTHASNGGAMRLENSTIVRVVGNSATNNLRGFRIQDCGIGGFGFVTRNVSTQNIESGIYIAAGASGGSQNITTSMNISSYNANNGLLCIGGINNKFSQNEVNGNWNAGFCAWGSANATLRDCGLYDNNRSALNGIGNTGDAKASIQINEAYNLLGTSISLNPAFRFIAEILDTQVHYTGLGSNTEKIGFLITSAVGQLADNAKNIIKVDDVGFIGQDYAIDLTEVDITNLRLSFGDNSYQSITYKAIKPPLQGNYNELPFSNHIMEIPSIDVIVDTLKQTITLHEGVGGNAINSYAINQLQSNVVGTSIEIIEKSTDRIQLRGLTFGNIYINGVAAGNDLASANNSLNAAFNMSLIDYKNFLVSEVGVNGDSSSGGSLPAIANNWYVSYGSNAGVQMVTATIGNAWRNYNPFYNGEALEKGHEFVWTLTPELDFMIGLWGAAEATQAGSAALQASNWNQGFFFGGSAGNQNQRRWRQADSSGVTVEQNGSFANMYDMSNGQVAIRFGQDGYLYLFEIISGGYQLIAKSNDTVSGTSVMIQWASYNEGSFPVMTERTEIWEVVADEDDSMNGEWANGLDTSSVIRSRMSFSPGEKITLNMNYFGRSETIGFGYTGTATGQNNAEDLLISPLKYTTTELLKSVEDNGVDWTWNTTAAKSYDPNGDGSDIGYGTVSVDMGLISFRYKLDNTLEMWHETDNVLMATKVTPFDGSAQKIFIGTNEANHAASRIPALTKYDMSAVEEGANITGWWYIESPDGNYEYPLFTTLEEAQFIDGVEGGTGTATAITYADDTTSTQFYHPDTNFVNNGTAAPQGGVFGNSINVVWNEKETAADANYAPTFTDITYTIGEGSAVNIQYKPQGDTNTYNVTGVPTGYADNGFAIVGTAETITDAVDIQHVLNVTKANDFGSDTGTITLNVTNDPTNDVSQNATAWTKAVDFSGSNERAESVLSSGFIPMAMSQTSITVAGPGTQGNTSSASGSRPWATSVVFKSDRHSSNQHIWNMGEGANSTDDNIYIRQDANGNLYFGWGRDGALNECRFGGIPHSSTGRHWGVYVAHNGTRLSGNNATAGNLAAAFDIRMMTNNGNDDFATLGSNLSTSANWTSGSTGGRMDRSFTGQLVIGGRGSNRNFHGNVASFVTTSLIGGTAMPTDAEIEMMITDPVGWMDDYKVGNNYRSYLNSGTSSTGNFQKNVLFPALATQVWLMGDGTLDSYSNMIRNQVYPQEQSHTKLSLISMQSNDIINVTISGLS